MSKNWMRALGEHYRRARDHQPEAEHLLLTDIDGTILDMRHMVAHVLRAYDARHGTAHFTGLRAESVPCHENRVAPWLATRAIPDGERIRIHEFYLAERWTTETLHHGHRAYDGVFDVLAWFQSQPRTSVALVTGRPNHLRTDTLAGIRRVAEPAGVQVADTLLFMNPNDWEVHVQGAKAAAVSHFRTAGYRPFAFIDNEPANLEAVAHREHGESVLLLHADTLYESAATGRSMVSGHWYDLAELVSGSAGP